MGEHEPRDSRKVTLKQQHAPGEPPRTGPREGATRQPEQEQSGIEQADDAEAEAALRELASEDGAREGPERFDRND